MKQFELKYPPISIDYLEGEPLKLLNDFRFYHNKIKFRKDIIKLQNLFQKYLNTPLQATGIRDSYMKEPYFESYLILFFSTFKLIQCINDIMENYLDITIKEGCFYLESNSTYMILLSKDINGMRAGIDEMEDILDQVLDKYFQEQKFEDYIQIYPFKLYNCGKK